MPVRRCLDRWRPREKESCPFTAILTGSKLLARFGDADTALVMYDTTTVPVPSAPGAEHVTVRDGKITYMRIVFDRVPFEMARAAASATKSTST